MGLAQQAFYIMDVSLLATTNPNRQRRDTEGAERRRGAGKSLRSAKGGVLSDSLSRSAEVLAVRVEDFDVAEEGGLGLDLGAVTNDDDLHVGGVEIFAGGGEEIVRS